MDAIKIPSSVPAELKAADLVLKRANELKAHDPVIAYWCTSLTPAPSAALPSQSDLHLFLSQAVTEPLRSASQTSALKRAHSSCLTCWMHSRRSVSQAQRLHVHLRLT